MILEIVNNVNCVPKKYKHSYLRSFLVLVSVTVMVGVLFFLFSVWCQTSGGSHGPLRVLFFGVVSQILLIIGLTHALVVFRVIAAVLMAEGSWEFLSNHSNTGAMMLGAVLHYLIITVMTRVRCERREVLHRWSAASPLTPDLLSASADQQDRGHEAL